MRKAIVFFLCCLVYAFPQVKGNSMTLYDNPTKDSVILKKTLAQSSPIESDSGKKNPAQFTFHKKHRLVAALLAFPLGVFGLHRIYMHTSPIVPLVYIATFGGLFGVLPFIDFVLILLNKDIHLTYTSNPHLFMWQKR
jgi:TM2 domain-containing membrane protein YozV